MQLLAPQCRHIEFWDEPPQERPDNGVVLRVQGRPQGVLQMTRNHAAQFVLQPIPLPCDFSSSCVFASPASMFAAILEHFTHCSRPSCRHGGSRYSARASRTAMLRD